MADAISAGCASRPSGVRSNDVVEKSSGNAVADHRRVDAVWRHRIHAHAAMAPFHRQRFGEADQSPFRRRVVGPARLTAHGGDGSDGNDRAVTLREHTSPTARQV